MRDIGLAHLSLLGLAPDALVRVAAAAGYDFVGIRVRGATAHETVADLRPGSPASRATRRALADSGLVVRDIEFLALDGATGRETWLPMLEAGAELGARTLSLAGRDPDEGRLVAALAELAADAAGFGIIPTLEPISYNAVRTVPQAARIARAAGAALLLDPLHIWRGGGGIAETADLIGSADAADLVPVIQLCDAPRVHPGADAVDAAADEAARIAESRGLRLAPGTGDLPLREWVAAFDAAIPSLPWALEVPNAPLAAHLGDVGYATRLRECALGLEPR